jgi:hypothetical protein
MGFEVANSMVSMGFRQPPGCQPTTQSTGFIYHQYFLASSYSLLQLPGTIQPGHTGSNDHNLIHANCSAKKSKELELMRRAREIPSIFVKVLT